MPTTAAPFGVLAALVISSFAVGPLGGCDPETAPEDHFEDHFEDRFEDSSEDDFEDGLQPRDGAGVGGVGGGSGPSCGCGGEQLGNCSTPSVTRTWCPTTGTCTYQTTSGPIEQMTGNCSLSTSDGLSCYCPDVPGYVLMPGSTCPSPRRSSSRDCLGSCFEWNDDLQAPVEAVCCDGTTPPCNQG
ncbi:MAG: hypothetical protein AAF721_24800 [Myxococcota bacterium]